MAATIACSQCGKTYQIADAIAGKQVRCKQCSATFTATPTVATTVLPEVNPFADIPPSQLPAAAPDPYAPKSLANPLGAAATTYGGGNLFRPAPGATNPSGGPTDTVMRALSGVMFVGGIGMLVGTAVMDQTQGAIYLAPLFLAPLGLILGLAGIISPNVVRACGKFGGHLSWHYKAIGYGLLGLYSVTMVLIVIGIVLSGYGQR